MANGWESTTANLGENYGSSSLILLILKHDFWMMVKECFNQDFYPPCILRQLVDDGKKEKRSSEPSQLK